MLISTQKAASSTGTVNGATISALEELMSTIDGIVRILADENERTQSIRKNINEVMKNQMVVQKVVYLSTAETIHFFFVRLTDLRRVDREAM